MSNQLYSNNLVEYALGVPGIAFLGQGTSLHTYIDIPYNTALMGPYTSTVQLGLARVNGGTTTISLNGITGTSTAASQIILTALAPPPFANTYFSIWVLDTVTSANPQIGTLFINSSGQIIISRGFNSTFSSSGTVGFNTFSVTYCSYT